MVSSASDEARHVTRVVNWVMSVLRSVREHKDDL